MLFIATLLSLATQEKKRRSKRSLGILLLLLLLLKDTEYGVRELQDDTLGSATGRHKVSVEVKSRESRARAGRQRSAFHQLRLLLSMQNPQTRPWPSQVVFKKVFCLLEALLAWDDGGDTGTRPVLFWTGGPRGTPLVSPCLLFARFLVSLCCPSGSDLLRLEISLLSAPNFPAVLS